MFFSDFPFNALSFLSIGIQNENKIDTQQVSPKKKSIELNPIIS